MNKKDLKILKNNNNDDKLQKKFISITLELKKIEIFRMQVDVSISSKNNIKEENAAAIKIAWNALDKKIVNPDEAFVGDGFQSKILSRKLMEKK